jgi:hypothetical protein
MSSAPLLPPTSEPKLEHVASLVLQIDLCLLAVADTHKLIALPFGSGMVIQLMITDMQTPNTRQCIFSQVSNAPPQEIARNGKQAYIWLYQMITGGFWERNMFRPQNMSR